MAIERFNKIFKGITIYGIVLVCLFGAFSNASAADTGEGFDPGEMIMHHINDSYEWEFWHGPYGTLHLPVIFYSADRGLEIFSSSRFFNDEGKAVEYNGYFYDHGKLKVLDEERNIYDFSITKNVFSMFISVALLLILFISIANKYKKNPNSAPKGIQSALEPFILFVRDDIAIPNIGEKKYKKFMPFLLTLFFFIWINNLLGLLPGAANVTGNISVTLALSAMILIIILFNANKHYWQHIFNMPGVPWWLKTVLPIIPIVEFIGIFTKPFSLMIRLFANITAGHIIILSLFSLIFLFESFAVGPLSVGFALFMNLLELLIALLQAFIFTLLSAMYIGGAVEEGHHHEEGHADVKKAHV